jgi:hypothetical protein
MRYPTNGKTTSRSTRCTSTSSVRIARVSIGGQTAADLVFRVKAPCASLFARARKTLLAVASRDSDAAAGVRPYTRRRVLVPVNAMCLVRSPFSAATRKYGLTVDDGECVERLLPLYFTKPRKQNVNGTAHHIRRLSTPAINRLVGPCLLVRPVVLTKTDQRAEAFELLRQAGPSALRDCPVDDPVSNVSSMFAERNASFSVKQTGGPRERVDGCHSEAQTCRSSELIALLA